MVEPTAETELPGHPLRALASQVERLIRLDREVAAQRTPKERAARSENVESMRNQLKLASSTLLEMQAMLAVGYPIPYA